ncbi:MAG TPA: 3'-5' exonuclease [Chitinophagales bacterium]|nr:3'-5' exonuclease [Chitinophagales bacterium]
MAQLQLDKPLAFIDLETTGINLGSDRIVEISILKLFPNGNRETKTMRINPGIPIPAESSAVHGIYDADVADKPTFAQAADELNAYLDNCDIAGYNSNKFDVPMLVEEFLRCGKGFDENRRYIDVMRIFTLMEKRTLEAAYRFFCDKTLENAHSAEADVTATYEVLLGQLDKYGDALAHDVPSLHEFTKDGDFVDFGRRMIMKNGVPCFNFGKYNGQSCEDVYRREPQYFDWIYKSDFPEHTKLKLRLIALKIKNDKNKAS